MKIYQKNYDASSIDFQEDTLLKNTLLGEQDFMDQSNELKKIKDNLETIKLFLEKSQKVGKMGSYNFDLKNETWTSSKELNEIFGIQPSDTPFEAQVWKEIMHPEHLDKIMNYLQTDILRDHKNFDLEYKIIDKLGNEKWVHGLGELGFDKNGELENMIGTVQDITSRKIISNRLEHENKRLGKTLFELHLAVVIIQKVNGNYILIEFNKKAQEIDKINEYYRNKKLIDIYPNINEFGILKIFDEVLYGGEPIKHHGEYNDGHIKGYRDSYIYRIEIGNGDYEIVSIYEDVTHIKKLEKSKRILDKIKNQKKYFISILVGTILLLGYHFYTVFNGNDYDKFYSEHYNKSDITIIGTTRSIETDKSNVYDGSLLFQKGEYEKALESFKRVEHMNIEFYLGIVYMELGNYEESIKNFTTIIENDNSLFIDQSEWLLSLCYIKTNKKVDAILILSKIANNPRHYKNTESLQLIEKL